MKYIKYNRLIYIVILALLLPGCAVLWSGDNEYFTHRIAKRGETLSKISQWYTGNAANWPHLAKVNPNLRADSLKIGDSVRIPLALVRRTDPMRHATARSTSQRSDPRSPKMRKRPVVKSTNNNEPDPPKSDLDESPSINQETVSIDEERSPTQRKQQVLEVLHDIMRQEG